MDVNRRSFLTSAVRAGVLALFASKLGDIVSATKAIVPERGPLPPYWAYWTDIRGADHLNVGAIVRPDSITFNDHGESHTFVWTGPDEYTGVTAEENAESLRASIRTHVPNLLERVKITAGDIDPRVCLAIRQRAL